MPSRTALTRHAAGAGDREWNSHLNEVPLVLEPLLVLRQPWYGGIVNPQRMACQRKKRLPTKTRISGIGLLFSCYNGGCAAEEEFHAERATR